MSDEEKEMTRDETFQQLAIIKQRLDTYPWAHHEVICMKDCLLLLIRTIAGENISELQLSRVGGGTMETATQQGNSEVIGGVMRNGGIEIAPGVMQYPAANAGPTMDVEANIRELNQSLAPSKAPLPDMPTPAPGSLMAEALLNEGKETIESEFKPKELSAGEPPTIAQIQAQFNYQVTGTITNQFGYSADFVHIDFSYSDADV